MQKATGVLKLALWLAALTLTAQVRDAVPVPDLPGYKTLKCDFHMHTVFSDGQVWPTTRVAEAWRDGLDAIAITDHGDYNPHAEDLKNDVARSYALARPEAEKYGILLIPAVEVTKGLTHCNALFVKDPSVVRNPDLLTVLRELHGQGAYIFWNHPGWRRPVQWYPDVDAAYKERLIQGVELVNSEERYPEAFAFVEEKKLAIFGNSDVHAPMAAPSGGEHRQMTLVFAKTADLAGVREALEARRTAAWYNGEVWGLEEHLRGLWQGAVTITPGRVEVAAGRRGFGLQIRNASAIPFRLRVKQTPAWMTGSGGTGEIPAQKTIYVPVGISKDAPVGEHAVDLEVEITNFHVGQARNLTVRLPLVVKIEGK
jgi:3',5'-nucleoside bisphosphate phosphatase